MRGEDKSNFVAIEIQGSGLVSSTAREIKDFKFSCLVSFVKKSGEAIATATTFCSGGAGPVLACFPDVITNDSDARFVRLFAT